MATNIISAINSETGVIISAPMDTVSSGEILNKIRLDNSGNANFKSEYVSVATPTGNQNDTTIRLTSMGEISGVGTGWRLRNNIGNNVDAELRGYRESSFDYELFDGYDTFVLSSVFNTHILKTNSTESVKAAGTQDFLTSTPEVSASDNYQIIGSEFDDMLTGGDQGDTLIGNLGSDQLVGGAGDDFFAYSSDTITDAGLRFDTITDFTKGSDKIDLTDGLTLGTDDGQVQFDSVFGNTFIGITDSDGKVELFATVTGVILDNSDFV